MACAEKALAALPPRSARLEMLARSIVTECLIELQRPAQALLSFQSTRPLYELLWGRRAQEIMGYLAARLLDALGCYRESEKAFRELIERNLNDGSYKDALLNTLTLFEALYRRGALEKAARLCEETSKLVDTPLCHPQMKQVWDELRAQVRSQALTVARILEIRLYVNRHWNMPAAQLPFRQVQAAVAEISEPLAWAKVELAQEEPVPQARAVQDHGRKAEASHTVEVPTDPAQLANGGYQQVRDSVDRQMIEAALRHTGGHLVEAAQLLGLSRNGLEGKVERLGLKALLTRGRRTKVKSPRATRLR
jgi:DNA-binding protein Fis